MCQSLFFERCRKLLLQQLQQNNPGGNQWMSLTNQQNTQRSPMLNLFIFIFRAVKESEWSKWRPDIHISSAGWDSQNTGSSTRKCEKKEHAKISQKASTKLHKVTIIHTVEKHIKWHNRPKRRVETIKDSKKKINNTASQRFLGRLPSDIVKLLTSVYFNSNVPRLRPAVTVAEAKPG